MVCGDINYTVDANLIKTITVELSDGQIATLGSVVRQINVPNIPDNTFTVHGIYQFQNNYTKNGKLVPAIKRMLLLVN
jgi:hypothetical protein